MDVTFIFVSCIVTYALGVYVGKHWHEYVRE